MGDLNTILHTPDRRFNDRDRGRGDSSWASPQPDQAIDRRLLLGHENAEIVQLTFRAAGLVARGLLAANFDPRPADARLSEPAERARRAEPGDVK